MTDHINGPIVQLMAMWLYTDAGGLMNEQLLRDFLDEVIMMLDMTVIMPTVGIRLPIKGYTDIQGKKPKETDYGYSFITMISESHVALHTWPHFNKAFLEVASCKNFDTEKVINLAYKYFHDCSVQVKGLEM